MDPHPASAGQSVLLTDFAWPDVDVERTIIEQAGHRLIVGSQTALPEQQVQALVIDHQPAAILTCWSPVSATAINASTQLRVIARMGVGLDNIAVPAATARGIWVTNVPDYCVDEVSDHAVALALSTLRGIVQFDRSVRAGHWSPSQARLSRISAMTVGIVGFGRIGRATAHKLGAFGCSVLFTDPAAGTTDPVATNTSLTDLLTRSDVVIVHAPLTPDTHHLIGPAELAAMKPSALLINVSRGGLVDTAALVDALDGGQISAAALDVLEHEPVVDPGLLTHPAVILTPHVAFSSTESLIELRTKAARDVVRVLDRQSPRDPCNNPAPLETETR